MSLQNSDPCTAHQLGVPCLYLYYGLYYKATHLRFKSKAHNSSFFMFSTGSSWEVTAYFRALPQASSSKEPQLWIPTDTKQWMQPPHITPIKSMSSEPLKVQLYMEHPSPTEPKDLAHWIAWNACDQILMYEQPSSTEPTAVCEELNRQMLLRRNLQPCARHPRCDSPS